MKFIKNLGSLFLLGAVMSIGSYAGMKAAEYIDDKIYIRKQIQKNNKRNKSSKSKIIKFKRG